MASACEMNRDAVIMRTSSPPVKKCLADSSPTEWHHTAPYSGLMAWKQMAGLWHLSPAKPHWVALPLPSFPQKACPNQLRVTTLINDLYLDDFDLSHSPEWTNLRCSDGSRGR